MALHLPAEYRRVAIKGLPGLPYTRRMPYPERDFFFEGNVVGYFEESVPSSPRHFKYMPYRGVGHWRLGVALASGSQRCYYVIDGEKHHFTVPKVVNYGLLEVSQM